MEVNSFVAQTWASVAPLERWAMANADVIVTVSQTLREQIGDKLGESLASRTLVIPNGVDISRFLDIAAESPGNAEGFHVGYTGILKADYGLEQIIAAARMLHAEEQHITFHLVGDGPARMALEASARGLSNVIFHGSIPFERIPAVLKGFNVLLYTSSERNAFQAPIKMCEYMASGRPIVAMRTPVTEWLLAHGKRGALVPMGDAVALADAIKRMQDLPDQGRALGLLALEECRNHTWESRARELLHALYARGVLDA
jgi:glycosyltransferase involved in cell wall biosynthesis